MNLGHDLINEQKQQLAMTPELIQSIQILQMSSIDLCEYIQNELLENPLLEALEGEEGGGVQDSFAIPEDFRERIAEDDYDDARDRRWEEDPEQDRRPWEQLSAVGLTMFDFLKEQIRFSELTEEQRELTEYVIASIDDRGYLKIPLTEIAEAFGCSIGDAEDALAEIQKLEPAGVGARNLAECLRIQMDRSGMLTPEAENIIDNHLLDLAENRIRRLASELEMSLTDVQGIADQIRRLEPRPGRGFGGGEATPFLTPDVFVDTISDQYVVISNEGRLPKLQISSYYLEIADQAAEDRELDRYLTDRFSRANWLIRTIDQRKETIYNVASEIVRRQQEFFRRGEGHLRPLTLKQVAEEIGVHESTVSRAINGKYMQSPRGLFELRYFFSAAFSGEGSGQEISANSIRAVIRHIIDGEDPRKPFSDQEIALILAGLGIDISRRTVAKYREGMGISASPKRRRFG